MGILSDDLVKRTQKYLADEKIVRNEPLVREILLVFPKSTICSYKKKGVIKWDLE